MRASDLAREAKFILAAIMTVLAAGVVVAF
jgi:hypothetical protein